MAAEVLLDRLKKVRRIAEGRWKACCPAHDDRTPSLAVRELPDGRILLKCFAGCAVDSIVGAAGLSMEDLFPKTAVGSVGPERRQWTAADLLHFLDKESLIVLIVAADLIANGRIRAEDLSRVQLARERIALLVQCLPT